MADLDIEQQLANKSLDRTTIKRLIGLLKPVRGLLPWIMLTELILVGTIIIRPWFFGAAVDHGLERTDSGWNVDGTFLIYLGLGLTATWLFRFILMGVSAIQTIKKLRLKIRLDHLYVPNVCLNNIYKTQVIMPKGIIVYVSNRYTMSLRQIQYQRS